MKTAWSSWRDAPAEVAVVTAYDRPTRTKRTYEVTITGIGKGPVSDVFDATSPGLARVAALDKYGSWIGVHDVRELTKKPRLNRSSERGSRRSITEAHQ